MAYDELFGKRVVLFFDDLGRPMKKTGRLLNISEGFLHVEEDGGADGKIRELLISVSKVLRVEIID